MTPEEQALCERLDSSKCDEGVDGQMLEDAAALIRRLADALVTADKAMELEALKAAQTDQRGPDAQDNAGAGIDAASQARCEHSGPLPNALKAAQPQETDHEGRPMTYWGGKGEQRRQLGEPTQPERVSVPVSDERIMEIFVNNGTSPLQFARALLSEAGTREGWVSVPREQIERCEALARAVMADQMAIESKWISVNESMPVEEGDDLCDWLTWNEADGFLVAEWDQVRDGWFADGREVENVTHWMALPPIPKVN